MFSFLSYYYNIKAKIALLESSWANMRTDMNNIRSDLEDVRNQLVLLRQGLEEQAPLNKIEIDKKVEVK